MSPSELQKTCALPIICRRRTLTVNWIPELPLEPQPTSSLDSRYKPSALTSNWLPEGQLRHQPHRPCSLLPSQASCWLIVPSKGSSPSLWPGTYPGPPNQAHATFPPCTVFARTRPHTKSSPKLQGTKRAQAPTTSLPPVYMVHIALSAGLARLASSALTPTIPGCLPAAWLKDPSMATLKE